MPQSDRQGLAEKNSKEQFVCNSCLFVAKIMLQRGPQCGHRDKLEDKLKKAVQKRVDRLCDSRTVLGVKGCVVSLKPGKRG